MRPSLSSALANGNWRNMPIARIENGTIVADREDLTIDQVPEHKRGGWMPLEGDIPNVDRNCFAVTGPTYQIEATRVLRVWTVTPKLPTISDVKVEAQRRIIALTEATDLISCIIKQSNANMRANKLNDKRLNGETLSEAEAAEAVGLRNLASSIEAIRDASNAIEASLPGTMAEMLSDARWPQGA